MGGRKSHGKPLYECMFVCARVRVCVYFCVYLCFVRAVHVRVCALFVFPCAATHITYVPQAYSGNQRNPRNGGAAIERMVHLRLHARHDDAGGGGGGGALEFRGSAEVCEHLAYCRAGGAGQRGVAVEQAVQVHSADREPAGADEDGVRSGRPGGHKVVSKESSLRLGGVAAAQEHM